MLKLLACSSVSYFAYTRYANSEEFQAGKRRSDLPDYSWEDISKHKNPEKSVWIGFKEGVYDVTHFIEHHPGGDKILLGAGNSIEPFWNLYRAHHKTHVYQMLESMRIGNLKKGEKIMVLDDPYKNDPKRNPGMVTHGEKPFNAETPNDLLVKNPTTPNELFFVRNHLPVPIIDPQTYRLELVLSDDKCLEFSLDDLSSKFELVTVKSCIQCAGNRRADMAKHENVRGIMWNAGAIGSAEWKGVRLRDIINYANPKANYSHAHIEAFDSDPNGPFGTNIPLSKIMDINGDVILALEMNGEPLPLDHGFPLRLIVPGYVGVRNVKWVKRITLDDKESPLIWHRRDYKIFGNNDTIDNTDFQKRPPLYEMNVQAAICDPLDGAFVESVEGKVTFKGYAYSGGGNEIARVDVTTDNGETWQEAELTKDSADHKRHWSWSLWEAKISISELHNEVCVKATDSSGNSQPRDIIPILNFRGLLNNSWHCIKVNHKSF
ncbi:unnamed protein product [Blepharisma stoltei]|uniref:sulfite oxidase n=1 Tax=Blepharisma stoltei TaxID=1481888 RepID=A0AAU9IHR0_9CILI|nr:unnamed protein product [Blepharisma stoltei]